MANDSSRARTPSAARQRSPLRGASGYVDSDGVQLHYLEYGAGGRDVVLVPGLTMPAAIYEPVAAELAKDYRVVSMDLRGRGLSGKPSSGFTLPDYARDLAALLKRLELRRPILVGHALGARILPAFDVLSSGVAAALVIVDPPATGPGHPPYATPLESFLMQLEEATSGRISTESVHRHFPDWTAEALRLRAEWLDTCDATAVTESYLNFQREDFFGYLAAVSAPSLFLYGAETHAVPAAALAEIRARNPRLEVRAIDGAGHMVPFEAPDAFIETVRTFIDRQTMFEGVH